MRRFFALLGCVFLVVAPASASTSLSTGQQWPSVRESVVYSFQGGSNAEYPNGLDVFDGSFFGVSCCGGVASSPQFSQGLGTIFEANTSGRERVLYRFIGTPNDGWRPSGDVVLLHDVLYGTTYAGGTNLTFGLSGGSGTVFGLSGASGVERVLHNFGKGLDGIGPQTGLILVSGLFYGTTQFGGTYGHGTVFVISPSGAERVIYNFKGNNDASEPNSGLAYANGVFYGTTESGGLFGGGTLFAVSLNGTERVLHSFGHGLDGSSGGASGFGPVVVTKGAVYGTMHTGGTYGFGMIYKVEANGTERVLYSFKGGADGEYPSSLIATNDGLYGTTGFGGRGSCVPGPGTCGTVFELRWSGEERIVYAFNGFPDGAFPNSLILVGNVFYGYTTEGGRNNFGTIFKLENLRG